MISRLYVKNFRSIVDMNIAFTYDEGSAPRGYQEMSTFPFLSDKTGRYAPCVAIYGANASGKTNIIRAFATLHSIIRSGIEGRYNPNKLHNELDETIFELDYTDGQALYKYALIYNVDTIIRESLCVDGNTLYIIQQGSSPELKSLAQEEYSEERLIKIYEVECCSSDSKKQHMPYLSRIGENYSGLNAMLTNAYQFLKRQITIIPTNKLPLGMGLNMLSSYAQQKGHESILQRFTTTIQRLDININRIEYKRIKRKDEDDSFEDEPCGKFKKDDEVHFEVINTYHTDIEGEEVKFNLREESEGTQILFGVLALILMELEEGNTLIIDELDSSLHPLIVRELVRLFKDKTYNEKNAQLIFTTHTTDLLDDDLMRVSEVAIVNKTLKKGTTARRLSQFEGIRNVTNFRKRYMEGAFKGIPYPYI